jgi:hypothetical protein
MVLAISSEMKTLDAAGLAVLAVLATGAASCKRPPKPAPPQCGDDLSRADVTYLQQQVQRGNDPCPDLATPKVTVDARGVGVDGRLVVLSKDVPSARARNIASLFQTLVGRRRLWRELHPGALFEPELTLTASAGVSAVAGASVVRSAAWAGFHKVHLASGDVVVDFDYATPLPPGAPSEDRVVYVAPTGTFHDVAKAIRAAHPGGRPVSFDRSFQHGS